MPFYGTDFNRALDIQTDYAYTGYFDLTKKGVLVNQACVKAIEIKVATNDRIQVQDDLFSIFKTNAVYTPVSNQVELAASGAGITDYHHVMNVKAMFVEAFTGVYISDATNSTPIRISTSANINGRTGERMLIASVTGNTNTNGTRYIRRYKPSLYGLYSDVNLLTPVAGNGTYSGTSGTISRVVYETAWDLKSGRKFSKSNQATIYDPMYEMADGYMKIYPLTKVCSEISVDYVSLPVPIDLADSTVDLLDTYSQRLIQFLVDEAARILMIPLNSPNQQGTYQAEISLQP